MHFLAGIASWCCNLPPLPKGNSAPTPASDNTLRVGPCLLGPLAGLDCPVCLIEEQPLASEATSELYNGLMPMLLFATGHPSDVTRRVEEHRRTEAGEPVDACEPSSSKRRRTATPKSKSSRRKVPASTQSKVKSNAKRTASVEANDVTTTPPRPPTGKGKARARTNRGPSPALWMVTRSRATEAAAKLHMT